MSLADPHPEAPIRRIGLEGWPQAPKAAARKPAPHRFCAVLAKRQEKPCLSRRWAFIFPPRSNLLEDGPRIPSLLDIHKFTYKYGGIAPPPNGVNRRERMFFGQQYRVAGLWLFIDIPARVS